jgi:tRNA 2-selenouridine synthase
MAQSARIEDFLKMSGEMPVIDVRTPAEFLKGHVPDAVNIPLFSNEDRVRIGTAYKKQSRETAMLLGLDAVGPRMREIVESALKTAPQKEVLLYCWRGGMRSGSVSWLLEFFGFKTTLLRGGYKSFRRYVVDTFEKPRNFTILSGRTGSGKTHVLKELQALGEQVIDLEALARHTGSAYGWLKWDTQPEQEEFENKLAMELRACDAFKTIWLEDESRRIGNVNIPHPLWLQMREAPVVVLDVPFKKRVENLVDDYKNFPSERLKDSTGRLRKALGGERVKRALEALDEGDLLKTTEIVLEYYDKTYDYGLSQRDKAKVRMVQLGFKGHKENAEEILKASKSKKAHQT